MIDGVLRVIAEEGPDRVEPRVRKRRHEACPRMDEPGRPFKRRVLGAA
jgi:hypothetical protein